MRMLLMGQLPSAGRQAPMVLQGGCADGRVLLEIQQARIRGAQGPPWKPGPR